jgi:hypothetical protein
MKVLGLFFCSLFLRSRTELVWLDNGDPRYSQWR